MELSLAVPATCSRTVVLPTLLTGDSSVAMSRPSVGISLREGALQAYEFLMKFDLSVCKGFVLLHEEQLPGDTRGQRTVCVTHDALAKVLGMCTLAKFKSATRTLSALASVVKKCQAVVHGQDLFNCAGLRTACRFVAASL